MYVKVTEVCGHIYSDQTGRFQVQSRCGYKYTLIFYDTNRSTTSKGSNTNASVAYIATSKTLNITAVYRYITTTKRHSLSESTPCLY